MQTYKAGNQKAKDNPLRDDSKHDLKVGSRAELDQGRRLSVSVIFKVLISSEETESELRTFTYGAV